MISELFSYYKSFMNLVLRVEFNNDILLRKSDFAGWFFFWVSLSSAPLLNAMFLILRLNCLM